MYRLSPPSTSSIDMLSFHCRQDFEAPDPHIRFGSAEVLKSSAFTLSFLAPLGRHVLLEIVRGLEE